MTKLKPSTIPDEKSAKLTIDLPTEVHRGLVDCAQALGRQTKQHLEPAELIARMLARLMTTDRAFSEARKNLLRLPTRNASGPNKKLATPTVLGESAQRRIHRNSCRFF